MADSPQEKLDHSFNKANDDSSARTIEYLRVRLLAERSVSKSARQRANELERRVEDLEEQLRVISLQRKMAEEATADVLSILESRGLGDTHEAVDSESDHETNRESTEGNGESTEGNGSIVSKRLIDSGSDHDCSPVGHSSLSWKGRCDYERSREKDRNQFTRKHRVSSIGSSSPKQHLGKSCRQIRRREARLVERKAEQAKLGSKENGDSSQPNGNTNHSDSTAETGREGSGSVGNERNITDRLDVNGDVPVKDIKEALKDQARLIDRYEEMEEVQRKWEEKFSENNNTTPDSYDPGIQSDVTEEQEEFKAQIPSNTGIDISRTEEEKAEQANVFTEPPKPQSNGFVPTLQLSNSDSTNQTSKGLNHIVSDLPTAKQKKALENPETHKPRPPQNASHSPHFNHPSSTHSFERPSSETGSSSQRGSQNDLYALVPHNPDNSLESVLDALKKAKSQLNLKMTRPPHGVLATTSVLVASRAEMPVGCAGLFRLPTDFGANEADTRPNFAETRSGPSASSLLSSHFDPYLEIRTGQSNYRPQPSYPYPSDVGFLRTFPSNGAAPFRVPEEDRMRFYSDNGRPNNNNNNMYS